MKSGKSLVDMARELTRIRENARDYVAPVERLSMDVVTREVTEVVDAKENVVETREVATPVLQVGDGQGPGGVLQPNGYAHKQIASYTDIPQQYYQRLMKENPELLVDNVNHGLGRIPRRKNGQPESRMLRTVGDDLRAFVSSKYRRLDNYDLLETVMPQLVENGFEVVSSQLTEMRLYLKATTNKIQGEVKKGDVVQYGLVISGSDVGAGSVRVEPLIYRLVCLNGLVMSQALRKTHLGRDLSEDGVYELLTDETRQLTDAAFWAQIRDVVKASMDPKRFEQELGLLRASAGDKIENFDIPEVVELAARAIGVGGEETKRSVVAYLANGADGAGLTRWGLLNGFTFAAQQEHVGYDESVDIERSASKLLHLPGRAWARIAGK